jgi:general secretion pathway protein L
VRGFDGGGQALTLALARARSLDWAQAEALKEQSSLVGGDPEVQAILTRALMPMVREVRQTLKQVSGLARKPIERLWLTGGTSRLEGLGELLARELGVAPQPLPDLVLPGLTPAHEDLQLGSLAVALAMRGHTGNRTSRFNLRRGDQTFQGDFSKVRERAMRLLALAAALFLLYGVRAYAEMALLGKRERQIDDAICAATKQALGKCVKDPVVARSLLAAAGGSTESTIPDQSAVALLAETASRMSVEGAKMTEMDVGIDQLQLHGTADSFETVDKVVTALKGYHCFGDVQRGRVQKSHDASEIEFNLSVRNDCAGGSQ